MENGDACELPAFRASAEETRRVLTRYSVIAVVGLSRDPGKPSHVVSRYLQEQGYTIIPVNPAAGGETILGEHVYPDLREIPGKVEVVQVFRPPADVPPVVEDAIAIGAAVVWMQEGIVNNAAAARAREAGMTVIMDRCMMKEHAALGGI